MALINAGFQVFSSVTSHVKNKKSRRSGAECHEVLARFTPLGILRPCSRSVPIDNADHRPVYWSHNSGLLGSGSARLGLSQKDGLPFRCWGLIITAQGHRRAHSLCLSASVRTQEHLVISLVRNCPTIKFLRSVRGTSWQKKTPAALLTAGVPDFRCRMPYSDAPSWLVDG